MDETEADWEKKRKEERRQDRREMMSLAVLTGLLVGRSEHSDVDAYPGQAVALADKLLDKLGY